MNISDALISAAEVLRQSGVNEYRREAASLLAFVLDKEDIFLIAHPGHLLTSGQIDLYANVVNRRAAREPFQYIVGTQEFYGLSFRVTPDVLIPRPETEILVEAAIAEIAGRKDPGFVEVGVGSGCISVSILHNVERASAIGVDLSPAALEVARSNAETHGVIDRLDLRLGDVFAGLTGKFGLIVSNPPYVPDPQLELLQAEVRQYEPRTALSGGADGLDVIERIAADAKHFLLAGGVLLMEIGFDQSDRVRLMFQRDIWNEVEFLSDLQGIPRILFARTR
jgi:release factor glutamine methyltransferase